MLGGMPAEMIAEGLTVPERGLQKAGITHATARQMMVAG
jgi:hypothetical protein